MSDLFSEGGSRPAADLLFLLRQDKEAKEGDPGARDPFALLRGNLTQVSQAQAQGGIQEPGAGAARVLRSTPRVLYRFNSCQNREIGPKRHKTLKFSLIRHNTRRPSIPTLLAASVAYGNKSVLI